MELNNTVLSLRTEKGYTQEQFAGMLGVSAAAVSKWERGIAYPDITLLPKIAEVFNVSVDYLLGYDVTCKKTISEVISEANRLRKELKSDEAEQLIKLTLARYPNNLQLTFELARHRFVNANYKKRAERDRLLGEAAEGFRYVAERDENKGRRDWSLHFLSTISLINKDFDRATEYNNILLCAKGLYPRANAAVIQLNKARDENALRALKEGIYGCIVETTILLPWITDYYMSIGDYDAVIKENARAVKVYEGFTDCGWIYNQLSNCYETLALAFANKGDFDPCLDYLEKACDSALKYDSLGYDLTYSVYDVPDDASVMEKEKHRASRVMLMALNSPERDIYAPFRDTERYREIIRKLEVGSSK